jgi:hypothetical protein
MRAWLESDRGRSWLTALGCYVVVLLVYAVVAGRERLTEHTPFNHFALLAEAWLNGRLDLGGPPPDYAQGNDFAQFRGKWYIPFPPFPALLIAPLVYLAGDAERVRDGQFFLWWAPLGPAFTFLVLEKLRWKGRSARSRLQNLALSLSFALGSVYFFTAVQGTVWFAAHVVAVALVAAYVWFSLDAEHPYWAGLMLGLGYSSRASLLFAFPFFVLEAWRACRKLANEPSAERSEPPSFRAWTHQFVARVRNTELSRFTRLCLAFGVPFALCFGLSLVHNQARFGDPFDVGYRHLQVAWQSRIHKWGLFDYHFLAKNLGVALTSLPWIQPLRINAHGLALWFTTPVYLYLLWPKQPRPGYTALLTTAACIGVPILFYQNTGWIQFGYRFSNDYAVFLFAALALSGRKLGATFWLLTIWAIAVNTFGALTFDRPAFQRYYYSQPTQGILYQPD